MSFSHAMIQRAGQCCHMIPSSRYRIDIMPRQPSQYLQYLWKLDFSSEYWMADTVLMRSVKVYSMHSIVQTQSLTRNNSTHFMTRHASIPCCLVLGFTSSFMHSHLLLSMRRCLFKQLLRNDIIHKPVTACNQLTCFFQLKENKQLPCLQTCCIFTIRTW